MKIEHIAMYVNDLEAAKEFFIRYFGASSNDVSFDISNAIMTKLTQHFAMTLAQI